MVSDVFNLYPYIAEAGSKGRDAKVEAEVQSLTPA